MKIQYIIPAAFGAYKAFRAENISQQLLYAAIGMGSVYMLTRPRLNEDVTFIDTPIPPGTNPDPVIVDSMVNRLHDVLTSWLFDASSRCDAYKDYHALRDAEFIAVANKYKSTYSITLRTQMGNTYQSGCGNDIFWWNVYFENWDKRVLERMDELNIS